MMKMKTIFQIVVVASLLIIFFNAKILAAAIRDEYPEEGVLYTSIMLSLLPAAILFVALRIFRGKDTRMFRIMLGVISMTYAWEFIADPWSVSLRMNMGLPLLPIIIYTVIGTVFLLLAVLAFRRVE
ncbi:MAG: hypothetical protein QXU81_00225 [Candidatus Bathyarchaeia archaeon]